MSKLVVYVLIGSVNYEGDTLISVHATKESAELAAMEHENKYGNSFHEYNVILKEVFD